MRSLGTLDDWRALQWGYCSKSDNDGGCSLAMRVRRGETDADTEAGLFSYSEYKATSAIAH